MTPLLEVDHLTAGYEGLPAIRDVSLESRAGSIVALLGPNGAGKTTTLRAISGLIRPMQGSISVGGVQISGSPPHRIVKAGVVQVPEGRGLVSSLTVAENFRLVKAHRIDPYELFPELSPLRGRRAGLLSGGEQQMLALARALVMGPELLLVDELSLGLAPTIVVRLLNTLRKLATETGLSVILVEQYVSQALAVADFAYVLAHGKIVIESDAERLRSDRALIEASYMGVEAEDSAARSFNASDAAHSTSS